MSRCVFRSNFESDNRLCCFVFFSNGAAVACVYFVLSVGCLLIIICVDNVVLICMPLPYSCVAFSVVVVLPDIPARIRRWTHSDVFFASLLDLSGFSVERNYLPEMVRLFDILR